MVQKGSPPLSQRCHQLLLQPVEGPLKLVIGKERVIGRNELEVKKGTLDRKGICKERAVTESYSYEKVSPKKLVLKR